MNLSHIRLSEDDKITVAFADDCPIQHKLIQKMIENSSAFKLVCRAYNGEELIRQLRRMDQLPEICILDMEMPVMDGINTVYYLSKVYPAIKVFGHTSSNDEKSKSEMLKSGALAVFSKNEKGEILKRIESLLGPCSFVSFQ